MADKDEINRETVEPLREIAWQRIRDGELPAVLLRDELLEKLPGTGFRSPGARPADFCRLCREPIGPKAIQWWRLLAPK